ncbi:MAG: efflux RND transporter permease subunit [Holosporales bacterium]
MPFLSQFIRRPIMSHLLMVGLFVLGILNYFQLPISPLPKLDFPTIVVSASLPGASPDTIARTVALPLERAFSAIAGIDTISSVSSQGRTRITIDFNLDRNIDAAAQDVSAAISSVVGRLPDDMPNPPTFEKIDPSDQPIIFFALTSETLPLTDLNDLAETKIQDRISTLPGVGRVEIIGPQKRAVRILISPQKLATHNLTLEDVKEAVQASNMLQPTGNLETPQKNIQINPSTQLTKAEDYNKISLVDQDDAQLRLQDVGQAIESVEDDRTMAWLSGQRAIIIAVSRQPGANTVQMADAVRKTVPELNQSLPEAAQLKVIVDRSTPVRASIFEFQFTFVLTIFLVLLVVYPFLQNARATLIPFIAMPLSVLMASVVMNALGFSLNVLTLMALSLALGFIIDDIIVVMENIAHHMEKGEKPETAAQKGLQEMTFTIISMTVSLAIVFVPILFFPGIIGRFFYEFGVSLTLVILASGLIALMFTPVMGRFLLATDAKPNRVVAGFLSFFGRLTELYRLSLLWSMDRKQWILGSLAASLLGTVIVGALMPRGFFPTEDTGLLFCSTEAVGDVPFEQMVQGQLKLAKILDQHPHVAYYVSSIGRSRGSSTTNTGRFFITLKPLGTRPFIDDVLQDLRRKMNVVPEIKISLQAVQNLRTSGSLSKNQYAYTLRGDSAEELYRYADQMLGAIRGIPGVVDAVHDVNLDATELKVDINRDKAADLGLRIQDVANTLTLALAKQEISNIYLDSNSYQVILQVNPQEASEDRDLGGLQMRNTQGHMVRLDAIASFARQPAPVSVSHLNQLTAATISFNLARGTSLSDVVSAIRGLESKLSLPVSIAGEFQGSAKSFEGSQRSMGWILLLVLIAIYIVMGMLYESLIHPITILSGLPAAGFGALLALWVTGHDLDVVGFIGVIVLMGIVKKNAIMMIDYALSVQRQQQISAENAIVEACLRRFRPIMMTTFAAFAGAIPLAIGIGAGAELRRPLGIAILGGLLVSQILTLYITPVLYTLFENLKGRLLRHRAPAGS